MTLEERLSKTAEEREGFTRCKCLRLCSFLGGEWRGKEESIESWKNEAELRLKHEK